MSKASPPDETNSIGLYSNPIKSPVAPANSKTMVKSPNFSRLKRLNSLFM